MKGFGDHPVVRRIELQIEGGGLDRLLLSADRPREAVGEGVDDAEVHVNRQLLHVILELWQRINAARYFLHDVADKARKAQGDRE